MTRTKPGQLCYDASTHLDPSAHFPAHCDRVIMSISQEPSTLPVNNIITARVLRLAPVGLIIDLGHGREGVIREREIAWDAEGRRRWRERFEVGQTVQAVPLKESVKPRRIQIETEVEDQKRLVGAR